MQCTLVKYVANGRDRTSLVTESEAGERHAEVSSSSGWVNSDGLAEADALAPVDVNARLLDGNVVLQRHLGLL